VGAIAIFCGAASGRHPAHAAAARRFAAAAARRGFDLVTGGGKVGLMGVVADAALAAGGRVIGVIPEFLLTPELGHRGLSALEVVASMHARKARMAELADAFVALPGGLGTLEEICEATTWAVLGLHAKPCVLLDVDGYFTPLLALLDHVVEQGFMRPENRRLLGVETDPERLVERLATAPAVSAVTCLART